MPVVAYNQCYRDPYIASRLGILTTTSNNEVLVCPRGYSEQSSEAQRSLVSSSSSDDSEGNGAKKVRVTFLTAAYVLKTEDVTMNGTSAVNMAATDLKFVEDMRIIEGNPAVGNIRLMSSTNGGGSEITGINAGDNNSHLCHHYVPEGKHGYLLGLRISTDNNCLVQLIGQSWYGGNIVTELWDVKKFAGITAPGYLESIWNLHGKVFVDKSYVKVLVTPANELLQSTTIHAHLHFWENDDTSF